MNLRIVLPLLVIGLAATPASAQTKSAQAEKLFKDGKALMASAQYPEACTAFEGSQKLDPNINTLANLANCREKNGQVATAWGLFLDLERLTRDDAKQKAMNKTAKDRAAALELRSSYLIINVPDDSRVNGLEITLDGEVVDEATWNSSLPIDGGDYEVSGKAPGHEAWSTKVTVAAEHDKQSVDVPKFKTLPVADPARKDGDGDGDGDTGDHHDGTPVPIDEGPAPTGMTGKRKLALVLGPVGLLAIIGAVPLELAAEGNYDDARTQPDDMVQADLTDKANQQRSFAIGLGVIGLGSVGVATYLWFTGDRPERATHASIVPTVSRDGVGFAIAGGF